MQPSQPRRLDGGVRPTGRRPGRAVRRAGAALGTVLLAVVVLGSLIASARIAYVGYGAHDQGRLLAEQVHWLETRVSAPAGATTEVPGAASTRPTGTTGTADPTGATRATGAAGAAASTGSDTEVLQVAFAALATAGDGSRPADARLPVLRTALARLDAPDVRRRYATALAPGQGAFLDGWSLLVAAEIARLSGSDADRAALRERAAPLVPLIATVSSGVLPSYGELYRPVDTVVLAAALRRADAVAGVPGVDAAVTAWLPRLDPLRDPGTKLLPHRTDATGRSLEGPRADSQAIIQAFWPSVDVAATTSSRDWVAFENTFFCPRLGLAAVCEYPGGGGSGDATSGPLIAGVSPVATVATLAAARAHGNAELADQISREAELFGMPAQDDSGRRYLDGDPLAGNALLAWARAVPVARELPGVDDRDPVAWPVWTMCALIPGIVALGGLAWRVLARRRFAGPLESDAAPPDSPYGGSVERPAASADW